MPLLCFRSKWVVSLLDACPLIEHVVEVVDSFFYGPK